jgi:peptidoglycan hydrolase-like protein with peptidoglycan-binding domain
MKYAIGAVVALALGVGIATATQAAGYASNQSAGTQQNMQAATPGKMHHARANRHMAQPKNVRQIQQQMRMQGFYKGPINGKWTPQTRRAFAQFQKQNKQFARAAHSGPSMPRHAKANAKKPINQQQTMPKQTQAPSAGSSTPQNQAMPSPTPAPSAGGSTPQTNQNTQRSY